MNIILDASLRVEKSELPDNAVKQVKDDLIVINPRYQYFVHYKGKWLASSFNPKIRDTSYSCDDEGDEFNLDTADLHVADNTSEPLKHQKYYSSKAIPKEVISLFHLPRSYYPRIHKLLDRTPLSEICSNSDRQIIKEIKNV